MKRIQRRALRNMENAPMAEYDATYVGKHEALSAIIAELSAIVAEMADALGLTEEYMAEITAPARELAEKLTARIRARVKAQFKNPEVRIRWKYSGFWDAGIYDLPLIYDGKGYGFRAGTV